MGSLDLRTLPLVFEGYQTGGRLIVQERLGAQGAEELLGQVVEAGANYVHVRNGEAGCFMARVERCLVDV